MKNNWPLLLFLIPFVLGSCVKPPEYPIEPVIEYVGMTKNTLLQGFGPEDTTLITISFTDGDGDIGSFTSGGSEIEADLFFIDLRDSFNNKFTVPFVPEQGTTNGISGEIIVRMLTTCCNFPPNITDVQAPCDGPSLQFPRDTLIYEVYMMDRAGNESNRIQTEPIILLCQ